MCRLLNVPSHFLNLLSNEIELSRNGHFLTTLGLLKQFQQTLGDSK